MSEHRSTTSGNHDSTHRMPGGKPKLPLRPASEIMRLERMGAFHQSRLSFMRVLLRRIKNEGWRFERPVFAIDEKGVGHATYRAIGPERSYTLVAFAHELDDADRSDRVIAEAWDTTFTLCDGEVDEAQIARLAKNVPLQEAGRVGAGELVLSRANKSVRLFNHVIEALGAGCQPDAEMIEQVGYLMRTTAVYGSGKFGAADRAGWAERPEFAGSFQPELLAVWLIRTFSVDLVEHLAKVAGGDDAARLAPELRRRLGVGNSTGLGMAPFLINHPRLIHSWIQARETGFALVRSLERASAEEIARFAALARRARHNAMTWIVADERQTKRIKTLRRDFDWIVDQADKLTPQTPNPWELIWDEARKAISMEGQEAYASLVMEPYGHLVDGLAQSMSADEDTLLRIDGTVTVEETLAELDERYDWIGEHDFSQRPANARVWYVSQEKLEPRLGERFDEPLEPYEQPLSPGRDASLMRSDLAASDPHESLGEFLMRFPRHRHMARRLQLTRGYPYGEIRDNTIDAEMLPIDLLRCKLSFFGATRFDPRSDRWLRITMYQGAPFPDEIANLDPDDLAYPQAAEVTSTQ